MVNRNRKAIELLYSDKCTILAYQLDKNEINKRTTQKEVPVILDQPCRLTYKNIISSSVEDNVTSIKQVVKLIIAPEITIDPGAKIIVTHKGTNTEYARSGVPAVYTNHQEVVLELFKERA